MKIPRQRNVSEDGTETEIEYERFRSTLVNEDEQMTRGMLIDDADESHPGSGDFEESIRLLQNEI